MSTHSDNAPAPRAGRSEAAVLDRIASSDAVAPDSPMRW
jgi:hypothetical protein